MAHTVTINPLGDSKPKSKVLEGNPLTFASSSNPSSRTELNNRPGDIKRVSSLDKSYKREITQDNRLQSNSASSIEAKKTKSELKTSVIKLGGPLVDKPPSDHLTDELQPTDSASNLRPEHKEVTSKHGQPSQKEPSFTRESSFGRSLRRDVHRLEGGGGTGQSTRTKRKMKKGIFVSYSPDAGFVERKFVQETVKQLKENNLAEDIWFDKDEKNTDSPCWFSLRMEAVERCRSALVFLSESYFTCPVSTYEGKALIERQQTDPSSLRLFIVLHGNRINTEIPKPYQQYAPQIVDLTRENHVKKSLAEKTSVVIGSFMVDLEKIASIHAPLPPSTPPDTCFNGAYLKKKICQWTANDLQEWLFNLGIKEFYRQGLAETMVDGFLLMALTDYDMSHHLGIDSRVVRKKIMQQILVTLDKEQKMSNNWHLRARTQRPRPNCVYLVYDPADVRLAQSLKQDLVKKGLQVIHHQKLGQSKEEFLQLNGPQMAAASFVLTVLTEAAVNSPFVFHEILFADWLGKRLITAMFCNSWNNLRVSLRAVLGDCPAVDFERKMYHESLDILEHHIKPLRGVPGVVLEQAYLNKMADGLRPLALLSNSLLYKREYTVDGPVVPRAFISYHWDMQSKVDEIKRYLEAHNLSCWADITPTMSTSLSAPSGLQRGHSSISLRSGQSAINEAMSETLQLNIQRNMKAAGLVLCCITSKYMQSDNCLKDLTLAESLHKPIIPLLMRFSPWPPEGAPAQVRKILVKLSPIDLSNEKLFKQNIHTLLDRVRKILTLK